jgi:hypothetical protein
MQKVSREVYSTLKLLTPYDIDLRKARYGNERDGCYILADLPPREDIISFGISHDVAFEMDMARQGRNIFMYDHTIAESPAQHSRFNFHRRGICAEGQSSPDLATLETHLGQIKPSSDRLILKLDVEGHEWGVFATICDETLERFDQILVELHWLDNLRIDTFRNTVKQALTNINSQFTLFHVHANNCRELSVVEGFMVADVIEVSYVRTSLVRRKPSTIVYPSSLNKANYPGRHDYPLLFFPFLPSCVGPEQIDDVVHRLDLEASQV